MCAPGCLLIVLLPLVGALIGDWLDGTPGSWWGAGIGFLVMLAAAIVLGRLLRRVKEA